MSEVKRGKFVSIHGIDGTGKSSTAESVVIQLENLGMGSINYDVHKTGRPNPYAAKKEHADRAGTLEERLAAYLESMMYHSDEIASLLAQGFHVVKSRYLDDICANFAHLGISQEKIDEWRQRFPMVQPDLKVILQLPEPERRRRIERRGVLDDKDLEAKEEGSRLQFFEDYLLHTAEQAPPGSILHVDTEHCDLENVSRKIIDHLLRDTQAPNV